ncbi:DNA-binding response regulator [Candidatus Shapirobacteria bacterium CG06_land_8_20_14_3_00_40_12]|uniref:DNA-binding response regulator n=2 Tax=Candidatus Shapironibacteriota TaxID=1752721 RepID=A0A2M7TT84_9BACT|nr:MAG: DNA-binding response regulator [Candidatus Shapirobacteria bacterium CG06_land_8_20_14_3_00_40_12]PIZ59090.1 MAG: DNA-binding response regulator [Candidatus Shapirobacteria bacterium CG_4_10_14_0_2_um_filter_40_12]
MKILVVEDDHHIAQSIKKGLEQERMVVDLAFDGVGGYDLAVDNSYDLIVLDLMLPGLNGLDLCSRLRQNKNHTPILILTARDRLDNKVEGLNCGADDYLTKPFAFEELLARIRALTRRPHTISETIISLEDLSLNLQTFAVKRAGREIKLTSKEFSLLEMLLRHPNQILTKDQITNHVWDYEADVLPNTVEVYIKNLRRKIDAPFKFPLIHTVRGFGYKISKSL